MQLDKFYDKIKTDLSNAGIEDAETETRVILRELAQVDRGTLFAHPEMEIEESIYEKINACINRRLMREPLQYILGSWDFMGLNFYVREGVLIPRPDTEVLVECALKEVHDGMNILDLCTGTGCIAISLLHYSNECKATAVDISQTAIDLAKDNAKKHSVDNIEFVLGDLYCGIDGVYDLIVSNPPYIDTAVIETLEKEVKDFEPHLALDGGEDGLDLIRQIIKGAPEHLIGGGTLLMEIGHDQGERVSKLMKEAGFIEVECIKDYAGHDRVVKGTKSLLMGNL